MLLQPPHPLTLVWITFRADQLTCWFWKETWRLCRGWVTRIGPIPSTSWLSVCFFFSSFKIPAWLWDLWMFDFFPIHFQVCTPLPLFHWMLHTHQFFFPSTPQSEMWLDCRISGVKEHGLQPTVDRNSYIVERQGRCSWYYKWMSQCPRGWIISSNSF